MCVKVCYFEVCDSKCLIRSVSKCVILENFGSVIRCVSNVCYSEVCDSNGVILRV